ncbi:MAG: hypothetical protein O2904_01395 [bacterium]|nr:hypothetical protein [bacterium]
MTNEVLFHTHDIAKLWNIDNENTLWTTLRRYCQQGLLYRLHRGLYSLMPTNNVSAEKIGAASLHEYCYLSTETVLARHGIILQQIKAITFVSTLSKKWQLSGHAFISRQLHPGHLHNTKGVTLHDGIYTASPERAIADLLYFNPKYHFDAPIDWSAVHAIQTHVGYPITQRANASP